MARQQFSSRRPKATRRVGIAAALALSLGGIAVAKHGDKTPPAAAELWQEPADIATRDLYWGVGGRANAPAPDADYRFVEADTSGHSNGYKVEGPDGRRWKVKVGEEAQSEVAASRILWAIGYHQPASYYLARWRMTGGPAADPGPGCFRLESDHDKAGEWDWLQNPFVGTRPLNGLLVANVVINNWDLGASQNRVYRFAKDHPPPREQYVVQDTGAAFGKSRFPLGTRNNVDDFEKQGFIDHVVHGRVQFEFRSSRRQLLFGLTEDDVVWTCRLFARLSDRQLADAFRAAGYSPEVSQRLVRKVRQKVEQGLALPAATAGHAS